MTGTADLRAQAAGPVARGIRDQRPCSAVDLGLTEATIRIDHGDLNAMARQARAIPGTAGLPRVRIMAGDALDEYRIAALEPPGRRSLPVPVMRGGRRVTATDPMEENRLARSRFVIDLR